LLKSCLNIKKGIFDSKNGYFPTIRDLYENKGEMEKA
jgi:hypothetical protein